MKVFKSLTEAINYGRANGLSDSYFAQICKYQAAVVDGISYFIDEFGLLG